MKQLFREVVSRAAPLGRDRTKMSESRTNSTTDSKAHSESDSKSDSKPPDPKTNVNSRHQPDLVNGFSKDDYEGHTKDNFRAWEAMATQWEEFQTEESEDGNDMFTQCLLPVVAELSDLDTNVNHATRVLDLGAGSGIIARQMARKGAHVVGLDFSEKMLEYGRKRAKAVKLAGTIEYEKMDLMDFEAMQRFMQKEDQFDIVTISTTLKSLPSIEFVAKALPLMVKPDGRIVIVDLHPAFSKPAGHRGMEVFEDPATGKQKLSTYIKVPQYLDIPPVRSEAVRGQPEPLWVFHRPFWALMDPFFRNGLVLDAMREPAFVGEPNPAQAQNYHNFQQTPMLLAFRLRLADRR